MQCYRDLERQVDRIAEEILRWESRAERVTASYSSMPRGAGDDQIQSAVEMLAELRGALLCQMEAATDARLAILRAIGSVGEERLRLLLEYRYVDGMTFEQVSEALEMGWRHTLRLHGEALQKLMVGDVMECHIAPVLSLRCE